jgi:flagellar basal body-associated protein FliL
MKKSKIIRIALISALAVAVIAGSIILYMVKQPHRDVQAAKTDYQIEASALVNEYLTSTNKANEKYLDEEGESKILEITGSVADISKNADGSTVVLLKESQAKAGVKCFFNLENSAEATQLQIGQNVKIKGAIISGAAFDEDLDMYEHAVLDKSKIIL